ncbi:MAG: EAL domain-containing protein [Lachnospiraceae bacterium]|nr:EAL domain-containing protein [Lachnospiraceae bacterium]
MVFDVFKQTAFLIAAIVITMLVLVHTLVSNKNDRFRNKLFKIMNDFTMICAVCESAAVVVRLVCADKEAARQLLFIIEWINLLFHLLLPMLFLYYIIMSNGSHRHLVGIKRFLFFGPLAVMEIMLFINPFIHIVYSIDDDLNEIYGPGLMLSYFLAFIYILIGGVNLIKHRRGLVRRRVYAMLTFFPVLLGGMTFDFLFKGISCELFAISLTLLGIMLTMENEDDRMDKPCGVYNRGELRRHLNNLLRLEQSFQVICIRLTNYDILMRLPGKSGVESMMVAVAEYLKSILPWYRIHRSTNTSFMIIMDCTEEEAVAMAEKIYVRFMDGLYLEDIDTPVRAVIMRGAVPEDISGVRDMMLMVDGPRPPYKGRGIISKNMLKYLGRSNELEEAMSRGLKNNSFSIYYHSIVRADGLKACALKALVRLYDEKLGELMPAEFIPQAERTGQIRQIGDIVLNEVCRFIKSGTPEKYGFEKIYVNLSFVQCMLSDFARHIIDVVREYGVDPHKLVFEITKPVNMEDHELLRQFMSTLKEAGFSFLLEDFGSGYINVEAIFALDFSVVKIDRNILWEAAGSDTGRVVLENSVRMIKDLDRSILVEGVENEEQIKMLGELNVDYMQGYYFSYPVPENEVAGLV